MDSDKAQGIKHGTRNGYAQHLRKQIPACDDCRTAQRAYSRAYYEANPEKRREHNSRWRAANPEYSRRWKAARPEKQREYKRRWQTANLKKFAEYSRRRRARKAGALTIPYTADQLAARMAYWGNRCWMCSGPHEEVDHVIPIALGGPDCLSNLRPACRFCNASKGTKHWQEMVA